MIPVSLDLFPPPADLQNHISTFFDFRSSLPVFDDVERADLGQIRFMLSGHGSGRFVDGHAQQTSRAFLLGPTTGPLAVTLYGPVLTFGVSILPQGWAAITDTDASLFVNRIIDAGEIFGPQVFSLADALEAAPDLETRAGIAGIFLQNVIAGRRTETKKMTSIINAWLETAFSPDIDALVAMAGLSRRQVERNCKRAYGVTPKLLARKYRAIRAAMSLARGDATLDDCVAAGFYDQSHLIREIKQFTGTTPGAIPGELSVLARLTLQNVDHLDHMRTPLTSGDPTPI